MASLKPRTSVKISSTILRVDKRAGRWEAVPIDLVNDARLSFDTRAFAVWLLAKPNTWQIHAGLLPRLLLDRSALGHVGRDKTRRFLRQLEQAGYLTREATQGAGGRWEWHSVFKAIPTVDAFSVDGSSVDGCSVDGKGVDIDQITSTTDGSNSNSMKLQESPGADVGSINEIRIEPPLLGAFLSSTQALLGTCPIEHRQAVVDEVAAIYSRGKLRGSPIGLLHRLIERARQGQFVPSCSISHQERRRLDRRAREAQRSLRAGKSVAGPAPAGEIAQRALAQMRANLKKPDAK